MKIYISADIEGTIGVLDGIECREGSVEYERAREYMTKEVIAVSRGALKAGAKEILVKDAHATGRNILIDDLPEEVEIVRGWSGHPFKMMQELDSSYKGVIFTGYHSGARLGGNNLAHTINGGVIHSIKINGEIASEFMINTYTAGYVGVPVIFVSGDRDLIEKEVKELNLGIETLSVKEGRGASTRSFSLKKGLGLLEEGAARGVRNISSIERIDLPESFLLEIEFRRETDAERAGYFPGMERSGIYSVEGNFKDYLDVLKTLLFLTRS